MLRRLLHHLVRRYELAGLLREDIRREVRRDLAKVEGDVASLARRVREQPEVPRAKESDVSIARDFETRTAALTDQIRLLEESERTRSADFQKSLADLQQQVARLARANAANADLLQASGQLPPAWDVERIGVHVRDAVDRASLHTDPYPHVIVPNLLPDDAFRVLLEAVPSEEFFEGDDPRRLDLKTPDRAILPLHWSAIWRSFSRDIVGGVLGPALAARFRPHARDYLRLSIGDELVDEALALPLQTRGLRLMLRRPGWKLSPHLDPRDQFITTLLYLARPGDPESHGTQLFSVDRENFVATWANTYYPEAEGLRCDLVKTLPFRGNLCLSFLNLGGGAHGAELPADAKPADLKRVAFQFYMGPDRDALNAVIDRLPPEMQVAWKRRVKKGERDRMSEHAAHR